MRPLRGDIEHHNQETGEIGFDRGEEVLVRLFATKFKRR